MNTEQRKSQVTEETDKLGQALTELAESITALHDRLQTILRSDLNEIEDTKDVVEPPKLVHLADEIRGHRCHVKSLRDRINKLIDLAEL